MVLTLEGKLTCNMVTSVMQTVRMYLTGTKLVIEDQAGSNVMNEAANCG